MGSISSAERWSGPVAGPCEELLERCLRGERWTPDLLDRALAVDEGRALLSVVVERLGDLFDPRLCATYVELFSEVIARGASGLTVQALRKHARRVRRRHVTPESVPRVMVLSRITLGADVAVTSVLIDAALRRYPEAQIVFVGPRKNFELFEAHPRIAHLEAPYARTGALQDRLKASSELIGVLIKQRIESPGSIVIDPDSRLSQLGMVPVYPGEEYFFFESRSFGGDSAESLPQIAARWAKRNIGIDGARPFVAPLPAEGPAPDITVSLGVGENPAKRVAGDFEQDLLRSIADTGASVLIDKGGTEEERRRVDDAVSPVLRPGIRTHDGAFAPFAAEIVRSRLFVGYDSAAGHVASATGVPLISIANGFVSDRMSQRWRPQGTVIPGDHRDLLSEVKRAMARCLSGNA